VTDHPHDETLLRRALGFARRGIGWVEPNPPVGAVVADDQGHVVGKGWHEQFGGPHAEIHALQQAGEAARGATLYVSLEPCCHHGKTPPCTDAIVAAGIRRVVIGARDPARHTTQCGTDVLRAQGIDVELCRAVEDEARELIAPFSRLVIEGLPWVHAKWAMTADGKVATRSGSSQWITNEVSRSVVHQLRGRMDAILTGIGTVLADDPLLTARPAGPRTPVRVILDSRARTPLNSQLVQTTSRAPVLVVTTRLASPEAVAALRRRQVEVLVVPETGDGQIEILEVIRELGRRRYTNVLVEAGNRVLGSLFDGQLVNEVHAFMAPVLAGGQQALSPIGGNGVGLMQDAVRLLQPSIRILDGDVYLQGRVAPRSQEEPPESPRGDADVESTPE